MPLRLGQKVQAVLWTTRRMTGPQTDIRALIFDWGGVLQRTFDPAPRQALERELGLPAGGVERAVFENPAWTEASLGLCSAEQAWSAILKDLGWPPKQISSPPNDEHILAFVRRFFAGDRLDGRLVGWVRGWRADGYAVALLSNAVPPLAALADDAHAARKSRQEADELQPGRWGLPGLFDTQVFSYQVGALKPDPRAYRAVLAKLDLPAAHTVFIDDALPNILGARELGLHALHFTGAAALAADLVRLGLSLPSPSDDADTQ
jgi:putative hydrolase of the HAD superfamily